MEKKFVLYKHTAPNGKVYIGITCKKPERRWNNGNGYLTCPHFMNAINKYGWENFKHQIIFTDLSLSSACHLEQLYIKLYDATNPDYGYNINIGGNCAGLGRKHSEATKEKISKNRKGKCLGAENHMYGNHHSNEVKAKISKAKSGVPNYKLRGREFSAEHKKHMSESHKGKIPANKGTHFKKSDDSIKRSALGHMKKIQCIETSEIFDSIKDASEIKHIDSSTLTKVCSGKRKTAGGYHWKYI